MEKKKYDPKELHRRFIKAADANNAPQMKKYMRDKFEFLGIKSPERRALMKDFYREYELPEEDRWRTAIRQLWQAPFREFQMVGMEMLPKLKKYWTEEDHEFIRELIVNKSWWDTVDYLAANVAGPYFKKFPELINEVTVEWNEDSNMWLNRVSLLFQLKYKDETDSDLLFRYIRKQAGHEDFFIRKAIGWALRQYARTKPEAVKEFVKATPLANLSVKEATKHLNMNDDLQG